MYKLLGRVLATFTVAYALTVIILRLFGLGQPDAIIVAALEGLSTVVTVLWSDDLFKDPTGD